MADAQVTAWLRCAGLSRFAPRFAAALISPNIFLSLAPSDLDALGVDSPADRKRLSDLIAELRRTSDLASPNPPPTRSSTLASVRHSHLSNPAAAAPPPHSRPVLESLADRNSPLSSSVAAAPSLSHKHSSHLHHQNSNSPASAAVAAASASASASASRRALAMRDATATVTVCVRKRPLSRKELSSSDRDIVSVNAEDSSLYVHELKEKVDLTKYVETHSFSFDNVFGEHVSNASVYNGTARPLVDTLFSGGRATCFAYGQTGAGKTFTMAGDGARNPGLYTLAVKDVFDRIREIESELWRKAEEEGIEDFEPPDPPQVFISFYEIYASRLQDLLNRGAKLECREDANNEVQIVGLTERLCEVEEDVLALIDRGSSLRSTGCTGANDDSSRSHAVFQIELRDPPPEDANEDTNSMMRESLLRGSAGRPAPPSNKGEEIGRLCFIDLAGSERGSDTASSTRQTRMEGAEINKSLLALKECIRAMDKKKDHTPFRGSKLTQVLKASFLGKKCRTVMIANISPASSNVEHTLNTLRYSDRVKEIKRERGSANTGNDGPKSLGARRATFSHGIGASTSRGTRSTYANFPSVSKTTTIGTENESPEELSSSHLSLKLDRVGLTSGDDMDDLSTKPPRPDATRRTKSRARVRISEIQPTATEPPQRLKETRLMRRRTSKASQLPQRPSLGGTMLPRPSASKTGQPDRVTRTMSARTDRTDRADRERISPATSPEADFVEPLSRPSTRAARVRDRDAKPTPPSPALTRGRARQLEMMRDDVRSSENSTSDAPDDDESAEHSDDTHTDAGSAAASAARARSARASNVAESAMKYYMTKKTEELPEEDLLFASSDDLFDDGSSDKRLLFAPKGERAVAPKGERAVAPPKPRAKASAHTASTTTTATTTDPAPVVPTVTMDVPDKRPPAERRKREPGSGKGETALSNGLMKTETVTTKDGGESDPLRAVVRMHHMQIEELMRLTEADVVLVNAAESGEMDPQEYALKLQLNLSQKLDIVKTLQSKLKTLV